MAFVLEIILWFSICTISYVYLGYPLAVTVLAKLRRQREHPSEPLYRPHISIIIPARNEARIIAKKLRNTLQLNYPKHKLEIIVVSDNSLDETEEIVQQFEGEGVRLIALRERHGKTKAQNIAVEASTGEVLVFSDANAMYVPEAVRRLVNHFQDPEVGCVSGELCYSNPQDTLVGKEENLYWRYEKFIKKQEDRAGSILGANGSIYAVRRTDYIPLEGDIISDLIEPLEIAAQGKKVVYENKAVSYEESSLSFKEEFTRRRRIVSRSIHSLVMYADLINPFRTGTLCFELLSHKGLRWLSSFLMVLLLLVNVALAFYGLYRGLLYVQLVFYLVASLGAILKGRRLFQTWFFAPYYFCLINCASILGVIDFVRGKSAVLWEPIRS